MPHVNSSPSSSNNSSVIELSLVEAIDIIKIYEFQKARKWKYGLNVNYLLATRIFNSYGYEGLEKKGLIRTVIMWKYVNRMAKKRGDVEYLKRRYRYAFLTEKGRKVAEAIMRGSEHLWMTIERIKWKVSEGKISVSTREMLKRGKIVVDLSKIEVVDWDVGI